MKLLVISQERELAEFKEKFTKHEITSANSIHEVENLDDVEVIFDFTLTEEPSELEYYNSFDGLTLFINTAKISLTELNYYVPFNANNSVFGFNGIPTFINRSLLEVTSLNENSVDYLEETCKNLETDFELVKDRVGMVTPRIVCMIINEAYYTVQEGTASREDIDLGMKLGTNYPLGPFEWSQKIGLSNVYELLEAIYEDTKEERYKICPLLKSEYLSL